MSNTGIRREHAERQIVGDVRKFFAALPPGAKGVRLRIRCASCDRAWERKFRVSDPRLPDGFEDLLREARLHGQTYEHRDINATLEQVL